MQIPRPGVHVESPDYFQGDLTTVILKTPFSSTSSGGIILGGRYNVIGDLLEGQPGSQFFLGTPKTLTESLGIVPQQMALNISSYGTRTESALFMNIVYPTLPEWQQVYYDQAQAALEAGFTTKYTPIQREPYGQISNTMGEQTKIDFFKASETFGDSLASSGSIIVRAYAGLGARDVSASDIGQQRKTGHFTRQK